MKSRSYPTLFVTIILFSLSAKAQEICRPNLQESLPSTRQLESIYESVPGDHQAVACAIELCGDSSEENPTFDNYREPLVDISPIENLGEEEIKNINLLLDEFLAASEYRLIPENEVLNFNRDAKNLIKFDDDWEILSKTAYSPYLENINDLSEICNRAKDTCPPGAIAFKNKLISEMERNPVLTAKYLYDQFKLKIFDSSNFVEMVQKNINNLRTLSQRTEGSSINEENLSTFMSSIGGPKTDGEINGIFNNFDDIYTETLNISGRNVLYCESEECRKGVFNWASSKVTKGYESVRKILRNPDIKTKLAAACIASMSTAVEKDKGVEEFYQRLPALKDRFLDLGLANMSAESKAAFQDFMNNKMGVDAGSTDELSNLSLISKARDSVRANLKRRESGDMRDMLYESAADEEEIMNSIALECSRSFGEGNYRDQFKPALNERDKSIVRASYFSCNHSELGDQIFYHELGHALSYFFKKSEVSLESKQNYTKTRSCVTDNYKGSAYADIDASEGSFKRDYDNIFTEEDTADHFSSVVSIGYDKLKACALIPNSSTGFGLSILPLKGDPHSSAIVRLIRNAIYQNRELPSVCKNIVNQYGERVFRKCE